MAHPKRKISKTRRDKRRTHYKATVAQIATCPITVKHIYTTELIGMRENVLQRQVVIDKSVAVA
jgi:large subunit ribosomal protein L32